MCKGLALHNLLPSKVPHDSQKIRMVFSRKIRYFQDRHSKTKKLILTLASSSVKIGFKTGLEKKALPACQEIVQSYHYEKLFKRGQSSDQRAYFLFSTFVQGKAKDCKNALGTINWIHLIIQNLTRKEVIEFTNFIQKKCNSKVPSFLLSYELWVERRFFF